MKENIKSINLLNKYEFLEKLNKKIYIENYNKFLEIFKEILKNNKWINIPNKELFFNKDIMACYSKKKISYKYMQSIDVNFQQCLEDIAKYTKNTTGWDIQDLEELKKAFCSENLPNTYTGYDYIIYKDKRKIRVYSKAIIKYSSSTFSSICTGLLTEAIKEKEAVLFPILRLGKKKNGENKLLYSDNEIFNIFLKEELIPKEIFDKMKLRSEYINLISAYKEKREKYEIFFKNDDLNDEKIIEEVLNAKNIDSLFNISLEITLSNGDVIERTYKNGIPEGNAIYYKNDKIIDIIEFKYVNGIIEGPGIIHYKNGNKEKIEYKNGIIEGSAIIYYKNGDREERSYINGIIQGRAVYTYNNGGEEVRNYINGKLSGKVIYKKDNIVEIYEIVNEKKIDKTPLYKLLNVDKKRINLDSYDENILKDPNRGHWDLFENKLKDEIKESFDYKIYARDPRLDIKQSGIVGIDFGTKSTVVVFQDDSTRILPMRISGVTLNKDIESSDYENPTVIEFKNIEKFLENYSSKKGRPLTEWKDVTVSHTAYQGLITGTSEEFNSVVSELKQWAGEKNNKIIIRDKSGNEKLIKPYFELKENDIDLIEIYAYYIGSYINNMRNGIYFEYFLSFPVNYEKEIRERILKSFEKGIKKSLPEVVLNDENLMKRFKVSHGTSEPAAYSVCALQEYKFEPEDDEKVYYGVFDFGGGTTDFDFGIWKASEDEESYDFDLEHFGAGGDRYLGGENILKELAFEVFKDNQKVLRQKDISFSRPEWCKKFMGDELLVDSSQEAKLNLRQLAEKLRGIWENSEEKLSEDSLKINLFNKKSKIELGVSLILDIDKINTIIENKIANGINNFFNSMERAFRNESLKEVNIFLAGNSCKHKLVKEIFEEEIKRRKISAEIFPPLGSKEAYKKMSERKIKVDENDTSKPTGKTGVAYGILETVSEGRINIIDKNLNETGDNNIKFKYYLGDERRKKLKCFLTPETHFDSFVSFTTVKTSAFNIYFTTSPEAITGNLNIEDSKRKRITFKTECQKGNKIYIKIISPSKIKYVVTEKDVLTKEFIEEGEINLE